MIESYLNDINNYLLNNSNKDLENFKIAISKKIEFLVNIIRTLKEKIESFRK